jgi:hypothetical protein
MAGSVGFIGGASGTGSITNVSAANPLPVTVAGGTAGDATAANQVLQIAQETAINTVLGTVTASPTANTIADRLKQLLNGTYVKNVSAVGYETVAASQTAQVLGGAGATGDFLVGLLVIPATTSPGAIALLDNATSITVFTGGASSVSNLVPFMIPIGANSASGAWKVTTGTNVSVIGIGNFT